MKGHPHGFIQHIVELTGKFSGRSPSNLAVGLEEFVESGPRNAKNCARDDRLKSNRKLLTSGAGYSN
jgi:hypothetical protein